MRETRSYGSVRGVLSNPYPYRDALSLNLLRSISRTLLSVWETISQPSTGSNAVHHKGSRHKQCLRSPRGRPQGHKPSHLFRLPASTEEALSTAVPLSQRK